jgi:two-component system, OmpR family, response regulator
MPSTLQHILYIDDEPDILTIGKMSLESIGKFTVSTAVSAEDALNQLNNIKPDLILLDFMMPEMDGYSLLKILRQKTKFDDTPIIFLTARARLNEVTRYTEGGANGVIPKPFSPTKLADQVTKLWEKFQTDRTK